MLVRSKKYASRLKARTCTSTDTGYVRDSPWVGPPCGVLRGLLGSRVPRPERRLRRMAGLDPGEPGSAVCGRRIFEASPVLTGCSDREWSDHE